ncbi:FAD:protein FMN transferase [uncultured Sulfitobacter sp.]|uniref:FAD:protein FMN transferase n=1 Tax=uncultured Sulfitobacter sp. TaxID=191468 RepID=UPI00262F1294|nr:FAD:protein FMN transferase [uncultured Sulfitobacter sp.]
MSMTRRGMILGGAALTAAPGLAVATTATQSIGGLAFGSVWRLVLPAGADAERARRVVEATVARVDAAMSPWRADSEVAQFNANGSTDWQPMSAETMSVATEAHRVARLTSGSFDPTVGPLVARYGFGPISGTPLGYRALELDAGAVRKVAPGLTLDLCGIAKGHALDQAGELLRENGFTNGVLELGGEVLTLGLHPSGRAWQVAIEQPGGLAMQRIVAPGALALATSGHLPQGYAGPRASVSHLIDPATAQPSVGALAAVSVLVATGCRADALATALTVLGPDDGPALAQRLGISALFLTKGGAGFDEIMTASFADHIIA